MAHFERTNEAGLPDWIADEILLNSLKDLKTQSLSLFTYAVEVLSHFKDAPLLEMRQNLRLDAEVLSTWHTFEIENACVRLVLPRFSYIPAELIDGEEQSPQVCFVWPLKQKTLRLYISEKCVLISDPMGPLFAQVFAISDLQKATHTVMTELLQRAQDGQS